MSAIKINSYGNTKIGHDVPGKTSNFCICLIHPDVELVMQKWKRNEKVTPEEEKRHLEAMKDCPNPSKGPGLTDKLT